MMDKQYKWLHWLLQDAVEMIYLFFCFISHSLGCAAMCRKKQKEKTLWQEEKDTEAPRIVVNQPLSVEDVNLDALKLHAECEGCQHSLTNEDVKILDNVIDTCHELF
jgi:hypothetical protein